MGGQKPTAVPVLDRRRGRRRPALVQHPAPAVDPAGHRRRPGGARRRPRQGARRRSRTAASWSPGRAEPDGRPRDRAADRRGRGVGGLGAPPARRRRGRRAQAVRRPRRPAGQCRHRPGRRRGRVRRPRRTRRRRRDAVAARRRALRRRRRLARRRWRASVWSPWCRRPTSPCCPTPWVQPGRRSSWSIPTRSRSMSEPATAPGGWSSCTDQQAPRTYDARDRAGRRARPPGESLRPRRRRPASAARSHSTSVCSTRSPACWPLPVWSTRARSTRSRSPAAAASVADRFEVLTGLPRPDRWVEARPGVLDAVLERAAEVGDVVVDTGFSLEDDADFGRPLSRNQLTLDAVAAADLRRRRGLGRAHRAGAPGPHAGRDPRQHARARSPWSSTGCATRWAGAGATSSAWSRATSGPSACTSCPRTAPTTDRALVAGKSVVELGDSPLRKALAEIHDAVFAARAAQPRPSAGRGPVAV